MRRAMSPNKQLLSVFGTILCSMQLYDSIHKICLGFCVQCARETRLYINCNFDLATTSTSFIPLIFQP